MNSTSRITFLFLVLLLAVAAFIYYPQYLDDKAKTARLSGLLSGSSALSLQSPTKTSGCITQNALPDAACTPGAVFANASVAQICVAGYTKTVRNVPQKLREEVFAQYGIAYPQPFGAYEVDHLIPLALGGSNDISNLFPQPANPTPGFHEKDLVEVFLQEQVCDKAVALSAAQQQIAKDWRQVYQNLTSAQIQHLKSKYKNWAN